MMVLGCMDITLMKKPKSPKDGYAWKSVKMPTNAHANACGR